MLRRLRRVGAEGGVASMTVRWGVVGSEGKIGRMVEGDVGEAGEDAESLNAVCNDRNESSRRILLVRF